ncbi:angiomotin-like protein 2b [Cololabis saira]|uniref:angiomotin-like protein 2b n=1 Tax=Cololabis saira TaxID=129043 RepID=UPI002AD38B85|nr:angiomotin-like protein 2b [Cololabis saira]XP_061588259.1 angiomotin-like protein 2b [Cololabis saira]
MSSTEEPSGTVLHRLIQEQLRYGNPTDTRTLLAIQQQALRGGSGSNSGPSSGGEMSRSPRSSLESLTQEDPLLPQLSARQEPQGQEHQGDYHHSESGYQLHGEKLPTYEQAKAHSQYLASHWAPLGPIQRLHEGQLHLHGGVFHEEADLLEQKCSHVRSLSEHRMQISLERRDASAKAEAIKVSSHSYPELPYYPAQCLQSTGPSMDKRSPPPEYSAPIQGQGFIPQQAQEPVQAQQHRYVQSGQPAEVPCYSAFSSLPPPGLEEPNQVELLLMENERLRQELEAHREKTARIQKLEQEIQRISEAYETLMQGSSKRENLEQTLRRRLVAEIRRLQDFNRDLRENLENARTHVAKEVEAADHNQHIMAKLLEQNEEQNFERERVERELQRLGATVEDQNLRAKQLEEALDAARARGRQFEEELRRKRAYVEKVERLQSALAQLQSTCEKRETLEMKLRTRLEQELRSLRAQQRQSQPPGVTMSSLQERLHEREERILALEADMVRWEQKYLEESTMRQFAMEVAATAAAQRDTTIINHSPCHSSNNSFNEDLPVTDHRNQEMENRIRALYAQILEKDAVIKILNQRLHQDQGRKDEQSSRTNLLTTAGAPLRPAFSTPSISTASTKSRGKSLSDDQTFPSRQFSAQSEPSTLERQLEGKKAKEAASAPALSTDKSAPKKLLLNPFRGLDELESEAVEIFI